MKYTKGKWKASISRGAWIVESVNNNNECSPICTMDKFDGEAVDKANANLIANSPLMLEALKMVVDYHDRDEDNETDLHFENARDAIAKAEGK